MSDLRITAQLTYIVETPTSFAFSIVAARTPLQDVVREQLYLDDQIRWSLEPYGEGTHQLVRLSVDPGELQVSYQASVSVVDQHELPVDMREVPFDEIPADVLPYLNPSRYCESDKLGAFAERAFASVPFGQSRVHAVNDWVNANLTYLEGSTDGSSSSLDVLLQRAGVCRDFAHVAISLCRALGIPARYVSGYGVGVEPQDFHGFFEAFVHSGWVLFDPTGMAWPSSLVRIGYGRDAADAPFATLVGQATLIHKWVSTELGR